MQKIKRQFPNIVEAPFGRRLGAILVDLIISILIALLAFLSMEGIYYLTPQAKKDALWLIDVQNASHLYLRGENNTPIELNVPQDDEQIITYIEEVKAFYLTVKVPNSDDGLFTYQASVYFANEVDFDFYVMVLNREKTDTKFEFIKIGDNDYRFKFKEGLSEEAKFEEWNRIYGNAIKDLRNSDAYRRADAPLRKFLLYGLALALVIGTIMPYLVLPLILRNGQTIGKYLFGLALVTKDGYQVEPKHTVIRFLILSFFELGASILLFGVPLFLASASVTVTRGARALHDIVANTYVVDARQSKIFKSKKQEELYHLESTNPAIKVKIEFYQMPNKSANDK